MRVRVRVRVRVCVRVCTCEYMYSVCVTLRVRACVSALVRMMYRQTDRQANWYTKADKWTDS